MLLLFAVLLLLWLKVLIAFIFFICEPFIRNSHNLMKYWKRLSFEVRISKRALEKKRNSSRTSRNIFKLNLWLLIPTNCSPLIRISDLLVIRHKAIFAYLLFSLLRPASKFHWSCFGARCWWSSLQLNMHACDWPRSRQNRLWEGKNLDKCRMFKIKD